MDDSDDIDIKQQHQNAMHKISRLQADYNSLQAQYDQAMTYVKQTEDLHNKNNYLTKENNKLKTSHDELNSRLEISLQLNKELKEKIENNKQTLHPETIQQTIEHEKSVFLEKIDQLNKCLISAKKAAKEKKKENILLLNSISHLLDIAQEKYNIPFSSIDQFETFLQQINSQQTNLTEKNSFSEDSNLEKENQKQNEIEKQKLLILINQNKKLKQKLKQEKSMRLKFESRYHNLEHKYNIFEKMDKTSTTSIKNQYERQINDITESYENQVRLKDQQISSLNEKIKILSYNNNKETQLNNEQSKQNPIILPPTHEIQKPNPLKDELCDIKRKLQTQVNKNKENLFDIDSLRKKLTLLTCRIKELERNCSDYKKRAETAELHEKELENKASENQKELNDLRIEIEEYKTQIHFIKSQSKAEKISSDKKNTFIEELNISNNDLKAEVNSIQNVISKQKKELSILYNERKNIIGLLQKQTEFLKIYERQLISAENQKRLLSKQFEAEKSRPLQQQQQQFLLQQQQNSQQQKQNDFLIPLSFWTNLDLPNEVMPEVMETVKIEGSQIENKVQSVINILSKFYINQIEKIVKRVKDENKINKKEKDFFRQFAQDILQSVDIVTNEINSNTSKEVAELINQMRGNNLSLQTETEKLSDNLQLLIKKLNSNSFPEASIEIDDLYTSLRLLKEKTRCLQVKKRKLQKFIKELNMKADEKKNSYEDINNKLAKENEDLKIQLFNIQNLYKIEKAENEKISQELTLTNHNHSNHVTKMEKNYQQNVMEIIEQNEKERNEILKQNQDLTQKIERQKENIILTDKEINQLKRTVQLLRSGRNSLSRQISEIKSEFAENQKESIQKFNNEKSAVHLSYSNIVSQLKSKNVTLRKLLDEMTEALAESESKNKDLLSLNAQISAEKRQAVVCYETQKNEMKREKQLVETKIRASQLANDIKCQSIYDELNAKCDVQKQQIYAKVANEFCWFFDARQLLDDNHFSSIISSVSQEMNRLKQQENSLKELLGVSNGKTIEEVVGQLLISIYH